MNIKIIDGIIAFLSLVIFIISFMFKTGALQMIFCLLSGVIFLLFIFKIFTREDKKIIKINKNPQYIQKQPTHIDGKITEIALLNDDDSAIAYWEIYGKSSLVIGLDVGENKVNINLINSTYASMIEVEHAVLNYSGGNWYLEDLGSQNGVSVVKADGKKYKLTASKPCLVEKGDTIYIALTKLKLY